MMEDKKCAVCGDEGLKLCTGCYEIRYCSKEHQKLDWKEHKLQCKTCKEKWDIEVGHHFVASRDLKPGAIILQQDPLVLGPMIGDGPPVCLGCCRSLKGRGVNCPSCSWPMCGRKQCWADGSQHELGECALLEGAGNRIIGKHALSASSEVYYCILVLRCLSFLKRDPAKWEKLMNMKDFSSTGQKPSSNRASIIKLVNQWLPEASIPEDWIIKICNAIDFGYSFELSETVGMECEGLRGIYSATDMFDDSQIPNATLCITKDARMVIRACVPILKGTRIIVNYGKEFHLGTSEQMIGLQSQQLGAMLNSDEPRKDPVALKALASGIYCSICPNQQGTLRPRNPRQSGCDWICDLCSDRKPDSFIVSKMDEVTINFYRLNRTSITDCEAFIGKYRNILHVHHAYMTDIRLELMLNYGSKRNGDVIDKWEAVTRDLIADYDVISPGLNRMRGTVLHQLCTILDARLNKLCERNVPRDENAIRSCYKMMAETLREVVTIFSWESVHTLEGSLVNELKQKLFFIEALVAEAK